MNGGGLVAHDECPTCNGRGIVDRSALNDLRGRLESMMGSETIPADPDDVYAEVVDWLQRS